MSNLKILGWDKKPKTLYRYIKEGDIFAFQIKIDLFSVRFEDRGLFGKSVK